MHTRSARGRTRSVSPLGSRELGEELAPPVREGRFFRRRQRPDEQLQQVVLLRRDWTRLGHLIWVLIRLFCHLGLVHNQDAHVQNQ